MMTGYDGLGLSDLSRLEKKVYSDTDNTDISLGVEFDPY